MAPPELRCEADWDDTRDLGPREVLDVVVLGHDEALPSALARPVDLAVELEDHRPPVERELACILVRPLDQGAVASWIDVTELSAVPALGDV